MDSSPDPWLRRRNSAVNVTSPWSAIRELDVHIVELQHERRRAGLEPARHAHQGFASLNGRTALPQLDDDVGREVLADVSRPRQQAEAVAWFRS